VFKKSVVFLYILTSIIIFIVSCNTTDGEFIRDESRQTVVGVDDAFADPQAYSGIIAVKGVVSFVYPSNSSFVIIDVKEYELCGVVTCAINEMLISVPSDLYSGELPEVTDTVLVHGEIVYPDEDFSLSATKVTRNGKTILERDRS
jgi:hypothetical protein